jgi:predicted dehydrogenase
VNEVRVAIVGMGIGRANGRSLATNPRSRVTALCDLLESRMEEFAQELPEPVIFYTDYREMVADPEIDAVFIGTPNQWHVPIALEAVKHGKHVLITKPLADALAPAKELVQAAEAAGVVNMMSLSTRFGDRVRYLGALAQTGDFGELYYARARSIRRSGIPDWSPGFILAGGGAFRDMGVHVLDAAWWLLGMPEPVSVSGVAGAKFGPRGQGYWDYRPQLETFYKQYNADDYGGGFIRFANGAGMQIESFWASHQRDELQIELFGTDAGASLDPLMLYRTAAGAPQDVTVTLPAERKVWDTIAEHFVACILDGIPCEAPLRHGLIIQGMMEALLESATSGHEVRIGS